MDNNSAEKRREAVVTRIKAARESYEKNLSDVVAKVAFTGSEWSIADLLRHVNGGLFRNMITRLLEEDNPQLGTFDPQAMWEQLMKASLGNIEEALRIATTITPEQMIRTGERNGQPHSSLDAIEAWATHLEEHLTQLQNEVRPREGLPSR